MTYTDLQLLDKIREMYPEIKDHHFMLDVDFNDTQQAYIVTFTRGKESLATHLEKQDADECMNGVKCVYFGVQVAQFIRNFEEREVFGRQAAA
jgi:hypothetical protein